MSSGSVLRAALGRRLAAAAAIAVAAAAAAAAAAEAEEEKAVCQNAHLLDIHFFHCIEWPIRPVFSKEPRKLFSYGTERGVVGRKDGRTDGRTDD